MGVGSSNDRGQEGADRVEGVGEWRRGRDEERR